MGRSGYCEDYDCEYNNPGDLWQQAVSRALLGKRGQAFLREMAMALDSIPEMRLIANDLERAGEVCAIGAVGRHRGIDMARIDDVAEAFGIARAMAAEIEFQNDEMVHDETPEERWRRMRAWVQQLLDDPKRTIR